jgi:hypothetical protein
MPKEEGDQLKIEFKKLFEEHREKKKEGMES